jgi:hypothetical protein
MIGTKSPGCRLDGYLEHGAQGVKRAAKLAILISEQLRRLVESRVG